MALANNYYDPWARDEYLIAKLRQEQYDIFQRQQKQEIQMALQQAAIKKDTDIKKELDQTLLLLGN